MSIKKKNVQHFRLRCLIISWLSEM